MASLTILSCRNDDNSTTLTVTLPPRRNGEVNFGALARINRDLLLVNPAGFDPVDSPPEYHATEAPMPPPILEVIDAREADDPESMGLLAEGAYREHA